MGLLESNPIINHRKCPLWLIVSIISDPWTNLLPSTLNFSPLWIKLIKSLCFYFVTGPDDITTWGFPFMLSGGCCSSQSFVRTCEAWAQTAGMRRGSGRGRCAWRWGRLELRKMHALILYFRLNIPFFLWAFHSIAGVLSCPCRSRPGEQETQHSGVKGSWAWSYQVRVR
jgi:hypothetical protein